MNDELKKYAEKISIFLGIPYDEAVKTVEEMSRERSIPKLYEFIKEFVEDQQKKLSECKITPDEVLTNATAKIGTLLHAIVPPEHRKTVLLMLLNTTEKVEEKFQEFKESEEKVGE